ncbi:uncharacterized protein LOC132275276 [Cornus florida]|uniref:uncharacterized protein LOC132275276 n=1 Tax=Cornus florida TaxID=4283 RepID=UPI00289A1186|nr:uncharacterized protein LOC132275276 [Cornus florida]
MKNVAQVRAYRMAVSEEFDETYAQEFGKQSARAKDSMVVLKDQEKMLLEEKMTYLHGVAFNQLNPSLHLRIDGFSPLEQIETDSTSSKELRQIGMLKMIWEESVSLWGEEGENQMGRVKVQELSFLNAGKFSFFDDTTVACTMESFEDGPHKGLSVHRFLSDQQVKVYGTRKSYSAPAPSAIPPLELKDPTEYYLERLRVPEQTLPSLHELWGKLREPPPVELRFPLHNDVFRELPPGKERFFTTSEQLDCKAITFDILGPIIRHPCLISVTAGSRDYSFIGLLDDCINRIVSKFCSMEMVLIWKPSITSSSLDTLQDQ